MTDVSACHAPLGSDVDPDVWYSQRRTRSGPGGGGSTDGSPGRQRVAREHGAPDLAGDLLGERAVLEAAPLRSHEEVLGLRLVGDVAHLALAHDRDDRVLDRAEARERGQQHEGVDRRRQLPAHDGVRRARRGRADRPRRARPRRGSPRTSSTRPYSSASSGRSGLSDAAVLDEPPVRRGMLRDRRRSSRQTLMIQPPSTLIVWPLIQSPALRRQQQDGADEVVGRSLLLARDRRRGSRRGSGRPCRATRSRLRPARTPARSRSR